MDTRAKRRRFYLASFAVASGLFCLELTDSSLAFAANPADIAKSTYEGVVKPVGIGVALFGICGGVATGFMRGFGTGVMTGLGGILLGAIIANAADIVALVPNM